jgi:hypothetical protein
METDGQGEAFLAVHALEEAQGSDENPTSLFHQAKQDHESQGQIPIVTIPPHISVKTVEAVMKQAQREREMAGQVDDRSREEEGHVQEESMLEDAQVHYGEE